MEGRVDRVGRVRRAASAAVAICRLGFARLSRRPFASILVALGVAAGTTMLVGTAGVSLIARDAAMRQTLDRLGDSGRTVRATVFSDTTDPAYYRDHLNPIVSKVLPANAFQQMTERGMLVEESEADDGSLIQVAALDHPARWLSLTSGRAPQPCEGTDCEGVVIDGTPSTSIVSINGLRIRFVGRGTLSAIPFGPLRPGDIRARHIDTSRVSALEPANVPVTRIVLGGVSAVAAAKGLATRTRSYTWTGLIRSGSVHPWNATKLVGRLQTARATLATADPNGPTLDAPDQALSAEIGRGRAAARRLELLASQAAVALLAFAAYAATRRRRSVGEELERLRHGGARFRQLAAFVAAESALLALAGALAGWAVALVGAVIAGSSRGISAGHALSWMLAGGGEVALVGAAAVLGTAVIAGFSLGRPADSRQARASGRVSPARALDAAALAALAVLIWDASARGGVTAGDLSSGVDPVIVLLPGLVALAGAVAVARLLPPVLRSLGRLAPRARVDLRLALLSAVREPGRATAAVTFLAISLATGIFALGYRASLIRGQRDQAAYQTGQDVLVQELGVYVNTLPSVMPLNRYQQLHGVSVDPVMRLQANGLASVGSGQINLLGFPARGLPTLRGWRSDFGGTPISTLAARLGSRAPLDLTLSGRAIPAGLRTIGLVATVTGTPVALVLEVQRADGTFTAVPLARQLKPGPHVVLANLPPDTVGGRAIELSVQQPVREKAAVEPERYQTNHSLPPLEGSLMITSPPSFRLPPPTWQAEPGASIQRLDAGTIKLTYSLAGSTQTTGVRADQPQGAQPIPALVGGDLSGQADAQGNIPLRLVSGQEVTLRPIATIRHFPTLTGSSFAVVDLDRLYSTLATVAPGLLEPNEAWLTVHRGTTDGSVLSALAVPPFRATTTIDRRSVQHDLSHDPLAESVVWALIVASILGLGLGVAGLLLAVATELNDEAGELRELEALGLPPRRLRIQVRLRAALIAALALAFGLAGGVVLTLLITSLVSVAANASVPLPPLQAVIPWGEAALVLVALALALIGLLTFQTLRAFRGESAGRLHG